MAFNLYSLGAFGLPLFRFVRVQHLRRAPSGPMASDPGSVREIFSKLQRELLSLEPQYAALKTRALNKFTSGGLSQYGSGLNHNEAQKFACGPRIRDSFSMTNVLERELTSEIAQQELRL